MPLNLDRILHDLSDPDPEIQTLALSTLPRVQLDDSFPPRDVARLGKRLDELASGPDAEMSFLARKARNHLEQCFRRSVREQSESPLPASEAEWIARLSEESSPVRLATLLGALIKEPQSFVLPAVRPLVGHDDPRVRANAVEVLELVGDESDLPLVLGLVGDENNRVRANAIKALAVLGHGDVRHYIEDMLGSSNRRDRESAVFCLSQLEEPWTERLLVGVLDDEYDDIRLRATRALARGEGMPSLQALVLRLADDDNRVREAAIASLTARGHDPSTFAPASVRPVSSAAPTGVDSLEVEDDQAGELEIPAEDQADQAFGDLLADMFRQLRRSEQKARLSRLLFKVGVDSWRACREGSCRDRSLMVHFYEILRYQETLRELAGKLGESPRDEARSGLLAGSDQYRRKLGKSVLALGMAAARLARSGDASLEMSPELAALVREGAGPPPPH